MIRQTKKRKVPKHSNKFLRDRLLLGNWKYKKISLLWQANARNNEMEIDQMYEIWALGSSLFKQTKAMLTCS